MKLYRKFLLKDLKRTFFIGLLCVLFVNALQAKVVRIEIISREIVSDVPEHGQYGAYEVQKGINYLEDHCIPDYNDPKKAAKAMWALIERGKYFKNKGTFVCEKCK